MSARTNERPEKALPHERDESAHPQESEVDPRRRQRIEKAHDDAERMPDTERRGIPSDVPTKP